MSKTSYGTYILRGADAELWHEKGPVTEKIYMSVCKIKAPKIGLELLRKGELSEIIEMPVPVHYNSTLKAASQQLLFFALNCLKKKGVDGTKIEWSEQIRDASASFGFKQQGDALVLRGLHKKEIVLQRKNERIIARYPKGKKRYELREQIELKRNPVKLEAMHILRLEDVGTGFTVAACSWKKYGEGAWIEAIRTTVESARMAKTLLIYAVWSMKHQGLKKAALEYYPEKGKEKQAMALYQSMGFEEVPGTARWEMDLERKKIQKVYLK